MPRLGRATRRGIVMLDIMMMLAILAVVVLAVMPASHPGEAMKLVAATTILSADVEYAQSATLARPQDPTIVRFSDDGTRYWLALASDPETPILRPDGVEPYEIVFGEGAYRQLWGVHAEVEDVQDGTLVFDSMGRLVQSYNGVMRFGNGSGELAVVVRATTGSVSIVDGQDVPENVLVLQEIDPPTGPMVLQPDPEAPAPPAQGGLLGGVLGGGQKLLKGLGL